MDTIVSHLNVTIFFCALLPSFLAIVSVARFRKTKHDHWPVVPGGLPFFGQAVNLGGLQNLFHKLEEWAAIYGSEFGVYEFTLFGRRFIVACREDTVFEIMKQRPYVVKKAKSFVNSFNSFALGLSGAEGDVWRADRRVFTPAFNHQNITAYMPKLKQVLKRLVRKWCDESRTGVISINEDMIRMTCDMIALVAFNVDFNTLSRRQCQMATDLKNVVSKYGSIRLWSPVSYWKIPFVGQYLDGGGWTINRLHDDVGKIVSDFETASFNKEGDCRAGTFLAKLITLNSQQKSIASERSGIATRLSHERLVGNILTAFLGGTDTTALTLCFCLWRIASDDTRLQDELAAEAITLPDLDVVSTEDLYSGAPRMRSLIHEVLRLQGPVPLFNLENVDEQATLAGYQLSPGGATIVPLMRFINTHPSKSFNASMLRPDLAKDDPCNKLTNDFNSRRWIRNISDIQPVREVEFVPPPKTVMPFGYGHRICPGKQLAETQMIMCLVEILRRFRITPEDGHPAVGETRSALNHPDREIRLVFNRRD